MHDWKNYVRDDLRGMWSSLTLEQRQVIAENMEEIAGEERWD
ncbi:TPA: recombinase RecA [Klebsiella pneumoniae]|nr:recombinase RecA [Klebsiella pneumoniae]HBX6079032.1 recombinase RecA [Klebsiella pneumoniae]HBX6134764.1 recombinase RecA [Klebsiella pneumoniae]HBX6320853.1 recombinase RecA [Klebsiella pneumoniae]HBX7170316.1 recombinase RecA [Klebsiella pneumoniae]